MGMMAYSLSFMIQVLIEQVNTLAVLTLNSPFESYHHFFSKLKGFKTQGKPVDFRPSYLMPHSEV